MFTYRRYAKCVYSERWSWGPRCALSVRGISEFLNTHICMASHTPDPDVAHKSTAGDEEQSFPSFQQQQTAPLRRKTWNVSGGTGLETVSDLFIWLLFNSWFRDTECGSACGLTMNIHDFKEEAIFDLQCWSSASLFIVKSFAQDTERNQGSWIIFANYSCLLWW